MGVSGAWSASHACMHVHTHTYTHTHGVILKYTATEIANGHFMGIMFISMCVCVYGGIPYPKIPAHPHAPPQELGAQITKNVIKLEQIELIQFCLKI